MERRVFNIENKIDFFVRTSIPPCEGVFFSGQIFDAYEFACRLVRSAKKSLVLIDNYIDESVLKILAKRRKGVRAKIYTTKISGALELDFARYNEQYEPIEISKFAKTHDRFLIVDGTVYHIGASLKDLGKKLFAFSKMGISVEMLFEQIL